MSTAVLAGASSLSCGSVSGEGALLAGSNWSSGLARVAVAVVQVCTLDGLEVHQDRHDLEVRRRCSLRNTTLSSTAALLCSNVVVDVTLVNSFFTVGDHVVVDSLSRVVVAYGCATTRQCKSERHAC